MMNGKREPNNPRIQKAAMSDKFEVWDEPQNSMKLFSSGHAKAF